MSSRFAARQFKLPQAAFISRPAASPVNTFDRESAQREQRALGIAALGLVSRVGERWLVAPAISRNRTANLEVWQDPAGSWRCSCPEFATGAITDAGFRCEHILAVKHAERSVAREPVRVSLAAVSRRATFRSESGQLFAGDPCARVFGELITPRQLGMIRQLARERGVDPEAECRQVLDCSAGDLSKAAASALIEHLAAQPRHTGEAQMPLAS